MWEHDATERKGVLSESNPCLHLMAEGRGSGETGDMFLGSAFSLQHSQGRESEILILTWPTFFLIGVVELLSWNLKRQICVFAYIRVS